MQSQGLLLQTVKKTAKHSLVYGIGMSFTAVSSILLVPLYTRFLSPADYGVYSLIGVIFSLLLFVYDFGMINAIFRWYYHYAPHEAALRRRVINTALIFLFTLALFLTMLLWCGAGFISRVLFNSPGFEWLVRLMLLGVFLQSLTWVPLSLLRIKEQVVRFTVITISGILVMISANYLLLSAGRALQGVYEAYIIAYLFMVSALFFITQREYAIDFSFKELKGMLKFGVPYISVLFFSWIIDFSDRYLLARLSSLEQVGLYSVGYRIGQAMYLAVKIFIVAWMPLMLSLFQEDRDNAQRIFGRIFTYFIFFISFLFLALSVFSRELIQIFTSWSYYEAARVIPWIAFSYVLNGIYLFMLCSLIVAKSIYAQPVILLFAAVINIALNFVLIPRFGMMGSAVATFVSYFFVALATYVFAQKLYPIPVEWRRITKLAFAVMFIYASGLWVSCPLGLSLLLKGMLMAAFFYVLYITRFFEPKEMEKLRLIANKITAKG